MIFAKLFCSDLVLCSLLLPAVAAATAYQANPSNYNALLSILQPGDTLSLASGTYPPLSLSGLNGTPTAWITITGPSAGTPATIVGSACCNTVEIANSSYLAIENLTIDSQSIDDAFGISAHGANNITHDILIQNNVLIGQDGSQQTDGISTKIPTWNWTIRNNTITGAGTGLYLGNSDGTDPFVAGLIENNLIQNTIGYNMEIKYQIARPVVPGMPTGPSTTIVRNNVFIKDDQASPDGDRPNVLLGGFPSTGAGSSDMYDVYGNFFDYNPREALLQVEGQVSIHDNILVDGQYTAMDISQSDAPLNIAYIYNNTVYSSAQGILFGNLPAVADNVTGNLVFAASPISGPIANLSNNIVDTLANAVKYVNAPSFTLGTMNFYPLPGQAQGPALNLSPFASEIDYGIDFNGTPKNAVLGSIVFRGAYAGQGTNPGWQLQAAIKPASPAGTSGLQSLQCIPSEVNPGQASTCSVTISVPTSSTSIVSLFSSSAVVTVPSVVNVAAGALSATFTATGTGSGLANVTAVLNAIAQTSTVTVIPLPVVTELTCTPSIVVQGNSANCTVTVSPAPLVQASVQLSSGNVAVTTPAAVPIAAGTANAFFVANVGLLAPIQSVTITASLNGKSAQAVLTIQAAGTGPIFYFRGNNSEFADVTNSAIVTPSAAPAGFAGTVVARGTGSLTFSTVLNGDGVAFEKGSQQNSNTAFLSFTGAQVGNVFNVSQGNLAFDLKSSYSFAQRQALPSANYRYVFDVDDGTHNLFYFTVYTSGGRLVVTYATGSTGGTTYYIPVGQENTLFGAGVVAQIQLTWNGTQNVLSWNGVAVSTQSYTPATPAWGTNSSFTIGAMAVPLYGGGYYSCDDPIAEFQMAGSGGGGTPVVSLNPGSITFPNQNVGTTSNPAEMVTLNNTGTGALTFSSIALTGTNPGDFAQTNTCGTGIAAGGSCTFSVTFTPTATGTRGASITITDNAAGSPHAITLSGTGTAPVVSLNPGSITFANQNINTTSTPAQMVTLNNTGTGALTFSSIALTGTNPGDFAQSNTCGTGIAAGGSCTFSVTFTPTATGTRSASITITDNAAGSPHAITLSGTGTAPVVSLNPGSITFANQNINTTSTPAQMVTLNNTGTGALTFSSIALTGANPGDFAQSNNCGAGIAAGGSCTFSVTFTPTVTGPRSASITITDNAAGSPHAITLSGTGTAPVVSLNPGSLTFASQTVGTTSTPAQMVTLNNTGTGPLTFSSIVLTGTNPGDFAQTNTCGAGIAAGGSCSFSVTFTPNGVGTRSASITITDNAAGSPHNIGLSGTGVATVLGVSMLVCTPTTVTSGSASSCTVTLTGAPSVTTAVTLSSSNTAAFTVPATVNVLATQTTAIFSATAVTVTSNQTSIITASLNSISAMVTLTAQPAGGPTFFLHGNNTEILGTTNGSSVIPTNAPAGLPGSVVVRGTGSVSLATPVINGDGVAFKKGGQQNTNTAFLNFPGAQVGNVFNVSQGNVTFYVKSTYSFAQRQALPASNQRIVFDVDDGTHELFYLKTSTAFGRLIVSYGTGGTTGFNYYVPAGQENALFGAGVVAQIQLTWNGTQNVLCWNGVVVARQSYSPATPAWSATSSFTIGAGAIPIYGGGYNSCDDPIAEFQIQ